MKRARLVLATAVLAACAGLPNADAHSTRAGAFVAMNVKFVKGAAVVTVKANVTGAVVPVYTVHYSVTGAISGGYNVPVADRQTIVVATGRPAIDVRRYPMTRDSRVALALTAQVVAASGVPAVYCATAVSREPDGMTVTVGTC